MNSIIKKESGHAPTFGSVVDQIFQNNLRHFFDDSCWASDSQNLAPVNIRETATSYELDLVAPGLRKEDFKLNLNKDLLTVAYEHTDKGQQQDQDWVRREFHQRSFSRSFTLDEAVDAAKISARYQDGVLQISLPKKEGKASISRVIDVQ
ncbi:hypothetical protein DCC81_17865 [Chitinophaga parva]|uniref:SHSP domain-containing protein n=1 Tax=Chitinophaga parva TaxID=2169414 RepID=A0A2T7BIJ6_9BACT|nr:Hsp20/alpha crystallin family protein [Chitinophaga parva]PUZ26106.1 hypothetical protein DCC81_17865 [Chitinophaga parva]